MLKIMFFSNHLYLIAPCKYSVWSYLQCALLDIDKIVNHYSCFRLSSVPVVEKPGEGNSSGRSKLPQNVSKEE